jgi:hypothetical protein
MAYFPHLTMNVHYRRSYGCYSHLTQDFAGCEVVHGLTRICTRQAPLVFYFFGKMEFSKFLILPCK